MKKITIVLVLLLSWNILVEAQYQKVSVKQIQQVSADSLAAADAITGFAANSTQSHWTLQVSPYLGDTVEVTAQVVVPPGLVTYSAGVWTMVLYDTTTNIQQWGGLFLRANLADSSQLKTDGFLNAKAGDIITFVGVVIEFPTSRGTSATQIQPIAGYPIKIIGSKPLPKPIVKNVGDFYTGVFSTGTVKFATGEQYEGMLVEFHNVTVTNKVNTARGTFSFVDQAGNELSDYDWSHYFTLGHGTSSLPLYPADTAWARIYSTLANGTPIDTIRGFITTASGSEGPRGYRICPIYPRDIVFESGQGSINISVSDAENWGKPGVNARVELVDANGTLIAQAPTNASSSVTISNIASGWGYYYRAFMTKSGIWGEQFWGEKTGISIHAGETTHDTLIHNTPYMPGLRVYLDQSNQLLLDSGLVPVQPGTRIRVELDIKNPSYAGSRPVSAYGSLYFDRDRIPPFDIQLTTSPQTISVGDTKTAVFYCDAPGVPGGYYLSVAAMASSDHYATTVTDASGWHDPSFSVGKGNIAFYPFSGTVKDESGSAYDGVPHNGVNFVNDRFGLVNSACQLNGTDQFVSLPGAIALDGSLTIAFWLKTATIDTTSWPNCTFILDRDKYNLQRDWSIGLGRGGKIQFNTGGSARDEVLSSSRNVNGNVWTFVAIERDVTTGNKRIFVNGELDSEAAFDQLAFQNAGTEIFVGASVVETANHHFFNGSLDDLRLFNRALADSEIVALYHEGGYPQVVSPPWHFVNTGASHTIIVPSSANPNINGMTLNAGDFIGVFYDSSGTLSCAGYDKWVGNGSIAIPAFGDDPTTSLKDGFSSGETFHWKIFSTATETVSDAEATYSPIGGLITNAGSYATNGISQLSALTGGLTTQCLSLRSGWNLISSFVTPKRSNLDSIFSGMTGDVIIMKNGAQKSYIPSLAVNGIGSWVNAEGYQVKMARATTMCISGQRINSSTFAVQLPQGWSIIPYPRESELRIDSVLKGISADIVLVKDKDARSYIPSVGVNSIGMMKPGEAYQIKMSSVKELHYPRITQLTSGSTEYGSGSMSVQRRTAMSNSPWSYTNTGLSHTVIIPSDVVPTLGGAPLSAGDFVGVFYDSSGTLRCAGADEWTGSGALAVPAFGDDPTTPHKDGFGPAEVFRWRIWKKADGHVVDATARYVSPGGLSGIVTDSAGYATNGISALSSLVGLSTGIDSGEPPACFVLSQNYPNPFNPSTTIQYGLPSRGHITLAVFNTLGQTVATLQNGEQDAGYHEVRFDGSNLPSGVYFYRIQAGSYRETKKLLMIR